MEATECNGSIKTSSPEDENWDNSWPVEVSIEAGDSDSKEDKQQRMDDSESDFLGFEDVEPAKQLLPKTRLSEKLNCCPHCDYKTRRKDHFKRHVIRHPEQTLYPLDKVYREKKSCSCTVCGYSTMRSDHFKRHMMRHTGKQDGFEGEAQTNGNTGTFESESRDKLVKSESFVDQIKTESESIQILTDTLMNGGDTGGDEWVSGLWPVEVRLEETEPGEERPHKKKTRLKGPHVCTECGYATLRGDHFKRHLMRHTGEKPYSCSYCEYRSTHAIHLKRHMSLHTNDRPYSCHYCPFRAIRPHHLRDHIRIHTGERPYVCHICGFSAAQSGNYKSHMRTHLGDKPYICEICGYSTVKNSNLVTHMRIHTGEKCFSCDMCDFTAMKKGEVSRHKRHVHGIGLENFFNFPLST